MMSGFNGAKDFGFLGSGGGGCSSPVSPSLLIIECDTGTNSSRRCGNNNCASGSYATTLGRCNTSSSAYSTISGGFLNIANGIRSTISGGYGNTSSCNSATISGGFGNTTSNVYSSIGGGRANISSGFSSRVSGGRQHTSSGAYSNIGGGYCNLASGAGSTISGGYFNSACSLNSFIGGGINNVVIGGNSAVLGGQCNIATGVYSGVFGLNVTNSCDCSFMSNQLRACNLFGGGFVCSNSGGTLQVGTLPFTSGSYGRFYSTQLQTASVINTPYALSFNNSGITNNFTLANDTLGNPTRITAGVSGTYNIVVSIQVHKTAGGGASTLDTWFRLNSTTSAGDVANSDRTITLANNGDVLLLTYNFMIQMSVGQYIQAMWSTDATSMHLDPTSANVTVPHPAGSSVILTISQV